MKTLELLDLCCIVFVALPSQTMVKSEPTGQYGSVYTIGWEVTSFPHISEYELKIRMVSSISYKDKG